MCNLRPFAYTLDPAPNQVFQFEHQDLQFQSLLPNTTYLPKLTESMLAHLTVYLSASSLNPSNDQLIFYAKSCEFQSILFYLIHSYSQSHFHSIFYLFSLRLIYSILDFQIYFLQFNFWALISLTCFPCFAYDELMIIRNNFLQYPFFSKNHQLSITYNFHLVYSDLNMLFRNLPSDFLSWATFFISKMNAFISKKESCSISLSLYKITKTLRIS